MAFEAFRRVAAAGLDNPKLVQRLSGHRRRSGPVIKADWIIVAANPVGTGLTGFVLDRKLRERRRYHCGQPVMARSKIARGDGNYRKPVEILVGQVST